MKMIRCCIEGCQNAYTTANDEETTAETRARLEGLGWVETEDGWRGCSTAPEAPCLPVLPPEPAKEPA